MDGNRTIDPSCSEKPPVAIDILLQLDIFGIILYSVLTFMAAVSMLVYIEECWYIYRKVPSNKKSAIIWVNGAAPVIGTMSCLGMWIPRATMFTDMTSACYFAIVVFKFLVLMIEEVGGDEAFLRRAGRNKLKISTGPCCCCCLCLPHVNITRRSLFLLKLGSFQFALMKVVFTILSVILWTNGNFDVTDAVCVSDSGNRSVHLDIPGSGGPDHHSTVACSHHVHASQDHAAQPQDHSQIRHVPAGARAESAPVCHHQHPGYDGNYRLHPAILLSGQGILDESTVVNAGDVHHHLGNPPVVSSPVRATP
ncbi:organic solute transporter subunit alpha-like isoform X2 [Oncorhynchus masou masou]|uniref:organic solute transporter subunit alpha-like isoform X2 n=1 Tax=Oncorhynchus masou masou TaxID=90313 RepID=UPI003182DD66